MDFTDDTVENEKTGEVVENKNVTEQTAAEAINDVSENDIKNQNESFSDKNNKHKKSPKKVGTATTVLIAVCAAFLAAVMACQATAVILADIYNAKVINAYGKVADYAGLLEVDRVFDENYIYSIDEDAINEALIQAYVAASGDRFASYFSPEEWQKTLAENQGNSSGIGVYVVSDEKGIKIAHVMANSPAEKLGLLKNDIIIAVEDKKVMEVGYNEAIDLVAGEIGTDVKLTLLRDGKEIDVIATRGGYEAETVIPSVVTYEGEKYGYIKITEFMNITAKQFKSVVTALLNDGCKGLVYDVRDNPGGQLDAIVEILDFLLPEGPIVHITDVEGKEVELYESGKSEIDCPMVVIANGNTASAAELFTSSLKDYDKATVVGVKTFGKGCGQIGRELANGGVLYVTSFLYNSPFSENYDKIGIYPDIEVELDEEYSNMNLFLVEYKNDAQLQRAMQEIATLKK